MRKLARWLTFVLVAMAIGVLLIFAARAEALHSKSAIRHKYRDYPASILGITDAITFNYVAILEDGGSWSITLTDATGKQFDACIYTRDFGGVGKPLWEAHSSRVVSSQCM